MSLLIKHSSKSSHFISRRTISNASIQKNRAHHSRDLLLKPVAADMIGTPDPISNLRPVKYYVLPNETKEEKEWRESCERVDEFNHKFWYENNSMFIKAKADYEEELKMNGKEVTAEAMSMFYKDFLNKAYDRQMEYNRNWWKMNLSQLYPGFKAAIRSMKKQKNIELDKGTGFWEKSFES
ncbi:hypothetical protein G6F46_010712 [Rhizopus delemar]|nr:hypothetical protein G6F55_009910 [Rhizopus delemar]KAG1545571.1 hypothetical protein G6F51_005384 [Rhizopus arrhizus]KAG1491102.1 hypothetical protein G6F54_010254 [Rhizopus delemar]KAG1502662.1 hypothetical protein G6F52_012348 [Rhizopus delemar]KAG1504137.1 hypothetical protein G6F53_010465 [Rhizopus delemar]